MKMGESENGAGATGRRNHRCHGVGGVIKPCLHIPESGCFVISSWDLFRAFFRGAGVKTFGSQCSRSLNGKAKHSVLR